MIRCFAQIVHGDSCASNSFNHLTGISFLFQQSRTNEFSEAALRASYAVAVYIAKGSKPFREEEFLKVCLVVVSNILCFNMVSTFNTVCLPVQILQGDSMTCVLI